LANGSGSICIVGSSKLYAGSIDRGMAWNQ